MIQLESKLTEHEDALADVKEFFESNHFRLGGNWDYDHGSFDCNLDEAQKVWLRIPFEVTQGQLDSEMENRDTKIKLGMPYVLKHVYNEGLDIEAPVNTYGAMINQFQEPVDKDAEIEGKWLQKAREVLQSIENKWQ